MRNEGNYHHKLKSIAIVNKHRHTHPLEQRQQQQQQQPTAINSCPKGHNSVEHKTLKISQHQPSSHSTIITDVQNNNSNTNNNNNNNKLVSVRRRSVGVCATVPASIMFLKASFGCVCMVAVILLQHTHTTLAITALQRNHALIDRISASIASSNSLPSASSQSSLSSPSSSSSSSSSSLSSSSSSLSPPSSLSSSSLPSASFLSSQDGPDMLLPIGMSRLRSDLITSPGNVASLESLPETLSSMTSSLLSSSVIKKGIDKKKAQHYYDDQQQQQRSTLVADEEGKRPSLDELGYDEPEPDYDTTGLLECEHAHSVCGIVQLNYGGVTRMPVCSCGGQQRHCNLDWNPFDDNAVRHGNDFYKFCTHKPRLSDCKNNQLALVEMGAMSLEGVILRRDQRLHCRCGSDHLLLTDPYERMSSFRILEDGSSEYESRFYCQKPPKCGRRDDCALITVNDDGSMFVKQNCRCSTGKVCPHNVRNAFNVQKWSEKNLYKMRCI